MASSISGEAVCYYLTSKTNIRVASARPRWFHCFLWSDDALITDFIPGTHQDQLDHTLGSFARAPPGPPQLRIA